MRLNLSGFGNVRQHQDLDLRTNLHTNYTLVSGGDTRPMQPQKVRNVFEAILKYGHDEDFSPDETELFESTDAPAGSSEKIEILRRRVESGDPLWHCEDRKDYSGLTGAVRPRE